MLKTLAKIATPVFSILFHGTVVRRGSDYSLIFSILYPVLSPLSSSKQALSQISSTKSIHDELKYPKEL